MPAEVRWYCVVGLLSSSTGMQCQLQLDGIVLCVFYTLVLVCGAQQQLDGIVLWVC